MVEIQLFCINSIDEETLDYSIAGIKILENMAKEKKLSLKPQMLDIKRPLPFPNIYFDAVYSHMLFI
jgi:hypothetical protein